MDGKGSRAVLRTDGGSEQEDGEGVESDVRLQIHGEEKRRNATGRDAVLGEVNSPGQLQLYASKVVKVIRPTCCPGRWSLLVFSTAASEHVSHEVGLKVIIELSILIKNCKLVFVEDVFVSTCFFTEQREHLAAL